MLVYQRVMMIDEMDLGIPYFQTNMTNPITKEKQNHRRRIGTRLFLILATNYTNSSKAGTKWV